MTVTDISDRKFDFGRVTGSTFGVVGRNFVPFIILALVLVGLPQFGIQYYAATVSGGARDASSALSAMPIVGLGAIVTVLSTLVLQGALVRASFDDLSGKKVNMVAALGVGLRFLLPLIGLSLIVGLGVMLGAILLFVPGLILAVRWVVAAPGLIVEKTGVFTAMRRSAVLTKRHRWSIFGLLFLYFVFVEVLMFVVMGFGGGLDGVFGGVTAFSPPVQILMAILQSVLSVVGTAGIASIYLELREGKEGVGVTELAAVFD